MSTEVWSELQTMSQLIVKSLEITPRQADTRVPSSQDELLEIIRFSLPPDGILKQTVMVDWIGQVWGSEPETGRRQWSVQMLPNFHWLLTVETPLAWLRSGVRLRPVFVAIFNMSQMANCFLDQDMLRGEEAKTIIIVNVSERGRLA